MSNPEMRELLANAEREEQDMRRLLGEAEAREELADRSSYAVDVAKGLSRGVSGAIEETFDLMASIDDWSAKKFGTLDITTADGDGLGWNSPAEAEANFQSPFRTPERGWELIRDTIPEAKTLPGNLTEGASQFVAGFVGAGKIKWLEKLGRMPKTKAAVQGAIADLAVFDEHEGRLSNLIQSVPELQNPVTEYLASDEYDGAIEGRIKAVIEGAGLGVIADQIITGVNALRRSRRARKELKAELAARETEDRLVDLMDNPTSAEAAGSIDVRAIDDSRETGGANEAAVRVAASDTTEDVLAKISERLGTSEAPSPLRDALETGDTASIRTEMEAGGLLDWSSIDDPADTLRMMDAVGEAIVKVSADNPDFNRMTVEEMGSRAMGDNLEQFGADAAELFRNVNIDGTLAGRMVSAQLSRIQIMDTISKIGGLANAGRATDAQLLDFRSAVDRLRLVEGYVLDSKRRIAQGLYSMRLYKREEASRITDLDELKGKLGENSDTANLAAMLDGVLRQGGTAGDVLKTVQASRLQKVDSVLREIGYGNMLSAPSTHEANIIGNTMVLVEGLFNKPLSYLGGLARREANRLRGRGTEDFTSIDEVKGYFIGTWTGSQRALAGTFKVIGKVLDTVNPVSSTSKADLEDWAHESATLGNVWKAAITSQPVIDNVSKVGDVPLRAPVITAPDSLVNGTNFWANTPRFIRSMLAGGINTLGGVYRVPGRFIQTVDELFKTIAFEQQIMSEAYAEIGTEVRKGIAGVTDFDEVESIVRQSVTSQRRAQAFAQEQTFQKALPGAMAQIEAGIRNTPFGWLVVPFIRTPWNIAAKSIRLTGATPLAEAIKRGGKDRDKALGQLAMGFGFVGTAAYLAAEGRIRGSGSGNNSERLDGVEPYSIKLGDTWHQFNRLDPFGMVLGLVADSVEGASQLDEAPEADHWTIQMTGVAAVAFAQNLTSKTWLQGVTDFFDIMTETDDSQATAKLSKWMGGALRNLMPLAGSNLERRTAAELDEFSRYAFDVQERLKAGSVLYREDLGVRRDALGRPVKEKLGLTTVIKESRESGNFLDHILADLDFNIPMPTRAFARGKVRLNSQQYSRFVELRGQVVQAGGLNFEDRLERVVRTDGFWALSEFDQTELVKSIASDYTRLAKQQLLQEFPDINARIQSSEQFRREGPPINEQTEDLVDALLGTEEAGKVVERLTGNTGPVGD